MKVFTSLFFMFFCLVATAQTNTNEINLYVNNIRLTKDSVCIKLKVQNIENRKISFRQLYREDICIGILHFQITNVSDSTAYRIYPCDYTTDLDHIICNEKNCNTIESGCSFLFELKFGINEISPRLKNGESYKIKAFINLKDVNIRTTLENLFTNNAISNEYQFNYLTK